MVLGNSFVNPIVSTASVRIRRWSTSRVTRAVISNPQSAIRNPQSQLPPLYIEPLLFGDPSLVGVEILPDEPKHRFYLLARRPRVQRAPQVRVQLLRGAEHRRRRYRAELPPLEIEARPPDHLPVCIDQHQVLERRVERPQVHE